MQASIRLEHELLAVETEPEVHAMVELVAPPAAAGPPRPPLRPALVIESLGVHGGPKLATTRGVRADLLAGCTTPVRSS